MLMVQLLFLGNIIPIINIIINPEMQHITKSIAGYVMVMYLKNILNRAGSVYIVTEHYHRVSNHLYYIF